MAKHEQNSLMVKNVALGNYLKVYFNKNQGVRLGETAVVSRRLHEKGPRLFPHIKIYTEQDAGQIYCKCSQPEQAVHVDVYHEPAQIQVLPIAHRIWAVINSYLENRDSSVPLSDDSLRLNNTSAVAARIRIATAEGQGNVSRLVSHGYDDYLEIPEDLSDHVHLIMELPEDWYDIVLALIVAIEDVIQEQGYQLRKIMGITHGFQKGVQMEGMHAMSMPFFPGRKGDDDQVIRVQNQKQALMALAQRLGGLEEVHDYLDSMRGNVFRKITKRPQRKGPGELDSVLDRLIEAGLVEKGILGPNLTEEGEELFQYLVLHQRELEALLRSILRRFTRGSKRYQRFTRSQWESRSREKINKRKILARDEDQASSVMAVPETVIEAARHSFMDGQPRLRFLPEDVRVYGKRSYVPVDICLLVDCSASMMGDKSMAAWQLAEHLLLSSRERVAVVIFQEMKARVAVPFTRNQRRLRAGLRSVNPNGMTPLASGLIKSLELIQESRVQNPLMVLITDGMPTYPLWTYDSKGDAIKAARMIKESKIRLACIGVRSNKEFLKDLATTAEGTLYVVDDLNRETLIQVLHEERQLIMSEGKPGP
ncbi:MAG: VWA domain-containing protein [Syntrophomonadaceae bacterium]|nr:VWA domain-containing protein [Syntrophomonadaceae bacterium]